MARQKPKSKPPLLKTPHSKPVTTVSVIMPCYNHGRFLADSIGSILNQTHRDFELIVVDDRSTDNSVEVMRFFAQKDPRVKVIQHAANSGLSRSRNDAISAATGEWIAFCDADDLWAKEKLASQLEMLRQNPECAVAYSESVIVDENSNLTGQKFTDLFPLPLQPSGSLFEVLCVRNFINVPSAILHKERAGKDVFFDEQIELVNDWWYWIRLSKKHRFLYSDRPLAKYRVHSTSTNITKRREYNIHRFRVYKRVLKCYPDLSRWLAAETWYHMAYSLSLLGKTKMARRCFWQAFRIGLPDPRRIRQSARAAARAVFGVTRKKQYDSK